MVTPQAGQPEWCCVVYVERDVKKISPKYIDILYSWAYLLFKDTISLDN